MNVLVTGGSGFIGSNLILHLLRDYPNTNVTNTDSLTYASDPKFGVGEKWKGYKRVKVDVTDISKVREAFRVGNFDTVFHLAAESHVDRSISGPSAFVKTNVLGTQVLLEAAHFYGVRRFIHVSTDEVYGSLGIGVPGSLAAAERFTEGSPIKPSSPYSASKAASDFLALSYHRTYGLPVIVTRCSNNYGFRQHPEKFIPRMILSALDNKPLPVYGAGTNVRDWIHVDDHVRGLTQVSRLGRVGEVYNFGGDSERVNIDVARQVLRLLNKPESLIQHVEDRLGHDLRYSIDSGKARTELAWKPTRTFEWALPEVVKWYADNREWARRML